MHKNNIYENILFVPWVLRPTLIDSEIVLKVFTINRKSLSQMPFHGRMQRLPMWYFQHLRRQKGRLFWCQNILQHECIWHCCHRKQYMLITVAFTLNDLPISNIIENILTDVHDIFRIGWTWYKEQLGTLFLDIPDHYLHTGIIFFILGVGGCGNGVGVNVCLYERILLILKIHQALYKNPLTKYHG